MTETGKGGRTNDWTGGGDEVSLQATKDQATAKTVMVYLMDKQRLGKEPLGIIMERRKSDRNVSNAIGMLRLARAEFARTEEEAQRIVIGDYV